MALADRIVEPGPKKILACDGGGIRGLISVEILARLESELRSKQPDPSSDYVLADFFDFVCGTSTGAVIAACIAAGMSASQIRDFYVGSGKEMFDKAFILTRVTHYKYNDEPLARKLRRELNKALDHEPKAPWATLDDSNLRTLLMMVLRNHSTDSPWPVWNNPFAVYNQRTKADGSIRHNCNLDLPLWQLLRASTAAPTYFPPEVVTLAAGTPDEKIFIFVDGGVTTYNNPAWLAFQMATTTPYGLNWPTGTDQMLLVSVGTGNAATELLHLDPDAMHKLHAATNVPSALMNAATAGWDMACRTVGACRFGRAIDREFGAMTVTYGHSNFNGPKLFSYVRYDPELTRAGLADLGIGDIAPKDIQMLDSLDHMDQLQRVGEAYANRHVRLEHLAPFA